MVSPYSAHTVVVLIQADVREPLRWLGTSLPCKCCSFWDSDPGSATVTPQGAAENLPLHQALQANNGAALVASVG